MKLMKTFLINNLLICLILISGFSCKNENKKQSEIKLESIYQKIKMDYDVGKRTFGKYKSVAIYNDLEFEFFVDMVSYYANCDMRSELANLISYPIDWRDFRHDKNIKLEDAKDFLKNYDAIMRDRLLIFTQQSSFPFVVPADVGGAFDDKRVLTGEHGSIFYRRDNARGTETYKIVGI